MNNEEYCGKLLFFENGKRCSWHYHKLKDEVFYLQSGMMMVYYSDEDDITKAKQTAEILMKDEEFYLYCSNKAKEMYKKHYHESIFLKKFYE